MHVRSEARMKKSCFKIQNLQQKHDVGIVSEVCVGELRWGVDSSFNFRAYCCVAKQTVWIFMILIFPQSSSTRNYTVFFVESFVDTNLKLLLCYQNPTLVHVFVCVCGLWRQIICWNTKDQTNKKSFVLCDKEEIKLLSTQHSLFPPASCPFGIYSPSSFICSLTRGENSHMVWFHVHIMRI